MAIQHAVISDPDIHEPKGVAAATAGQVYVADGAGSGAWTPSSVYGELYITGGTGTQALTTTAALLNTTTNWTAGSSNLTTLDATDGDITTPTAGPYFMHFWISFDTDSVSAGTLYTFYYAVNGVAQPRSFTVQKLTGGVDRMTGGAFGIYAASANDYISLFAKSSVNSTITVREAGFQVHRI